MPDEDDAQQRQQRARLAQDPYLDPFWGILKNKVSARTQDELTAAESDLVAQRLRELHTQPVAAAFDLDHLRGIHRHLFQDVYEWAGQLRTVDMRKTEDPAGWFFPHARLREGAANAFTMLAEEDLLRGLKQSRFLDRLAVHLDQVNHLHPFREGNGRTQRVLFTQLADQAGYRLDWQAITGERNDAACRAAGRGDLSELRAMLAEITTPTRPTTRRPPDPPQPEPPTARGLPP